MENSELERRILELLKNNARLSSAGIAQCLGCGTETVEKIIQALEEKKIIRGYTAIVNAPQEGTVPSRRFREWGSGLYFFTDFPKPLP